ncbi:MAG: PAS domain S-box protein [Candidatus Wallbacteria bacterium]|nr:PAS domain S-box protein [Candidatus Wallbacteria bacterium]
MKISELLSERNVPVVAVDSDGWITHVNDAFSEVFGWTREEVLGRHVTCLIPPHLRDAHHLGFSRFLLTERPTLLDRPITLRAVAKDGREFDAEHRIQAEKSEGRWTFAATIRPLPGR